MGSSRTHWAHARGRCLLSARFVVVQAVITCAQAPQADILNSGKKVAMLVGAGAKHATNEVIEVAELLGCGVAKATLIEYPL